MVRLAVGLFCIIAVIVPWWMGALDPTDSDNWLPLGQQLVVTLIVAIAVWRMFENDGIVLVAVLLWLLSGPIWHGLTEFMVLANAPPASAHAASGS